VKIIYSLFTIKTPNLFSSVKLQKRICEILKGTEFLSCNLLIMVLLDDSRYIFRGLKRSYNFLFEAGHKTTSFSYSHTWGFHIQSDKCCEEENFLPPSKPGWWKEYTLNTLISSYNSSDDVHFFLQKENEMVYQTLDKNGMASRAVLRTIISEINIWLFLPLAGFNTSYVTFLGLKQKWQRTLSNVQQQ